MRDSGVSPWVLTMTQKRCTERRREARLSERVAAKGVAAAAIRRAHRGRDAEGIHGRFVLQHFVEQARALEKWSSLHMTMETRRMACYRRGAR
jgi:hypothetical protein